MAKILFDEKLCTGCSACAMACMDQNDIDVERVRPYRRIVELEEQGFSFRSESCKHCENPACAETCPVGSLFYDGTLHLTRCDGETCVGCHSCVKACPYDAISILPDGKIGKCDGCAERQMAGLIPACVRVCPTGALHLETE